MLGVSCPALPRAAVQRVSVQDVLKVSAMPQCTISLCDESHRHACPLCGRDHALNVQGPGLFLEALPNALCRTCGKKLAPAFFFQAEDGIRDIGVTGVQTCALPI